MSTGWSYEWFRTRPAIAGGAPEDDEDTPTPTDADTTDWQKRYTDLQPEYTRTTQALKDEQAIWDDEQAVLARIAEKYPHLMADEDDTDDDDDDVTFDDDDTPQFAKLSPEDEARLKAHDEWIAQQAQAQATEQFNKDLAEEAGDRSLSRQAKEWIFNETIKLGDGRDNLKKAFASWVEFEDGLGESYLERVKKSKRAPHVPANGQTPNSDEVDWSKLSRHDQDELMAEMARARMNS